MCRPPVLVVDDNPSIRDLVAEILALEDYPVVTASNGFEALAEVERAHPALVILDMRMPALDGWGFTRELRARGIELPILVMTATHNAREWAAEIEAADYLAKPFSILDLVTAVERLCTAQSTSTTAARAELTGASREARPERPSPNQPHGIFGGAVPVSA